jgi:exosortase
MSLFFPTGRMLVDNPCSGLRSLIALLALGALLAKLTPGPSWRRLLLVAGAVPIALIANAARLTSLMLAAEARDVSFATGMWHDLTGYALYATALLLMLALQAALLPPRRPRRSPPLVQIL